MPGKCHISEIADILLKSKSFYEFGKRFYPKRLVLHFKVHIYIDRQWLFTLGIEPTTLALQVPMLYCVRYRKAVTSSVLCSLKI